MPIPCILSMLSKDNHNTLSEKWALGNGLTISMNKTVSMNFSSRQNMHGFCFEFDDLFQFLKETTEIDCLDLWQQNVLWTSYWVFQSKHPMNILKVFARSKWGADRATLLKICRSRVRPNWDYGCIVYGPAPKTSLAKLDSIHTERFRPSLGQFRSSPVETLYVEAYEPPLFIIETHRKKCLCYISSNWTPIQEILFLVLCVIPNSGIDTQAKKRLWITLAYIVSNYQKKQI